MKIFLVAATRMEIAPTLEYLAERIYFKSHHHCEPVITGVGMMQATYTLTKMMARLRPDIAIQVGIAGSLHPLFCPGTVVVVKEEILGDLGVFENNELKDVFDLDLAAGNEFPFSNRKLINPHQQLISKTMLNPVRSITVNEITTNSDRIQQLVEKYLPVTETMEGAAFHFVCLNEGIPFIQLRAVSNLIGERDKAKWKTAEAIEKLNEELIRLLNKLGDLS